MPSYTISIIIAVVCIIVGTGIGMLIAMAFSNRGNESKSADADANGPYDRVAAILRDRRDASLLTEFEGRIYASAEPLSSSQHEKLEAAAREWYNWLRLPPVPEEAKPAADTLVRAASNQSKTVPVSELSKTVQASHQGLPRAGAVVPPVVAAAVASNVERNAPKAPAASIVEQIDEILQDMVAGTPLAEKSIHLVEEPDSDVIVWIGLEHYEGINNVPDIEARTIIQAAVREWEKRSEAKPINH